MNLPSFLDNYTLILYSFIPHSLSPCHHEQGVHVIVEIIFMPETENSPMETMKLQKSIRNNPRNPHNIAPWLLRL